MSITRQARTLYSDCRVQGTDRALLTSIHPGIFVAFTPPAALKKPLQLPNPH